MECGQLTPQSVRKVNIFRNPGVGFGFVAGSARPVVVRSVISGGPSENKLLSGDQILAINDEDVSEASRERFIELVRNAKDSITLTVLHPHQSPKSAFISAAKKEKLRSNPGRVRFSELVTVGDTNPDMLKMKDSPPLLLIPNVLKVFLENGQIKSFTFDGRTTVKDVMVTLQDRLSLCHRDHFSLVLEYTASDQNQKYLLLQDKQPLAHVVHRTHYQGMRCLFRISFFPKDPADILDSDPAAFEYLYIQSRNDVIRERLGAELKPEILLGLSALHIYISVSSSRPGHKISLRGVEKEWGLEPFLPPSLLHVYKEKPLRKALAQHLKIHQNQLSGSKMSIIQAKLRYLRILNELPTFAGVLFNTVGMSLILLMDWPEATSFACLVAGYYRLLVDPKKGIFYRTTGHLPPPQIIKADHISMPEVPGMPTSAKATPPSSSSVDFSFSKCTARAPYAPSENQEPISLCYLNLQDKQRRDVNQNLVTKEARPRTKSDPTPKGLSSQHGTVGIKDSPEVSRSRSFTMDTQVKLESAQIYCDSCKAKIKSHFGGGDKDVKCKNPCRYSACRDNMVDLISLPPPEHLQNKEEEEGEHEKEGESDEREIGETATLLSSKAPPPPGFGDNSSDEEETNRIDVKGQDKGREQKKDSVMPVCGDEELPVTLIDSVQTRTVKDHAKELDDALVSTLQALEALAASEDFPNTTPQHTAGLIVLAAITPESSMDSGHETNSSELTDGSEMVTAIKQHHNTAYFLAHHLNKESLLSRKDLPFKIQTCAAQAVLSSPYSLARLDTSPLLKPAILQQHFTGADQQQNLTDAISNTLFNFHSEVSTPTSPEKFRDDTCLMTPISSTKISQNVSKKNSDPSSAIIESSSEGTSSSPAEKNHKNSSMFQKDRDIEEGSLCDCQLSQAEPSSVTLGEPSSGGHDVLNNSPTDDERLHAKACSAKTPEEQLQSQKIIEKNEITKSYVENIVSPKLGKRKQEPTEKTLKTEQIPSVPNSFVHARDNAKITTKSDTDIATTLRIPEKVPTPIQLEDCDAPAKPRARAPFKLRKLFSATFPTRMRRETDERQAQLLKVKQYEMEFLEELLKPQGKVSAQHHDVPGSLVPGRCPCQVRSSPLQKVPGMSREQRRSCDCKRIIRGIRAPPNPFLEPDLRSRSRVSGSGLTGIRLVRSSSLESHKTEKMSPGINTSTADSESNMHYTKLPQMSNRTDENKKEAPYNPHPTKSQKKDSDSSILKSKLLDTSGSREEPKTPVILPRQGDTVSVQTKLPGEEGSITEEKCCSFRHCFNCRRCLSADENNDKDELSYSIPMQILPGMHINSDNTPVLSQTLQVLDATACSGPEDIQTQEIDLRTATFEGSLAKVNALRGRSYSLPDGFISVQLDTSELLTVLRQCLVSTETGAQKLNSVRLGQHKQELTLRFKEFRASCRRMAGVDKNPEHMLIAVTSSFQVLCGLIETFVKLVFVIQSDSQRQELLSKVEEVVRNYTFLLRAAEESSARTIGHSHTVVGQLAKQTATVATAVSTFSRSLKTLMNK
ncbi:FERM and PDZ domain-containing protein 3 [Bufo bufo]|uniref:FERM and PDZ domain-containing protein 3 n=1 Tax=Bufo bufo TaxID=8384 RepID=UPI001ABDAEC8|nr:FERM and PDZ domain-containing protein 3 [Bufo bufo]